jgi:Fe2+ or Zn2+ uptake regulation protein
MIIPASLRALISYMGNEPYPYFTIILRSVTTFIFLGRKVFEKQGLFLTCIKCGEIIDFCCQEYDELGIPLEIQKEFTAMRKRMVIKIICRKCRKKK